MKHLAFIACIISAFILFQAHIKRMGSFRYIRLARIAESQKLFDYTAIFAAKGLRINPYNTDLNGYIGVALIRKGKNKEALKYLYEGLKYNPNRLNTLVNTAYANIQLGNFDKAKELITKIKKIKPSYVKRKS